MCFYLDTPPICLTPATMVAHTALTVVIVITRIAWGKRNMDSDGIEFIAVYLRLIFFFRWRVHFVLVNGFCLCVVSVRKILEKVCPLLHLRRESLINLH